MLIINCHCEIIQLEGLVEIKKLVKFWLDQLIVKNLFILWLCVAVNLCLSRRSCPVWSHIEDDV